MRDPFGIEKGMRLPDGTRVRFRTKPWRNEKGEVTMRSVFARVKGENVGGLHTAERAPRGEVIGVEVLPPFKRKKVATNMWNHAKAKGYNPQHSRIKTAEGEAWSKVTKGLPSYLRSTPKGMLSPGLQRRVRINEMGRTAARGAARAKQNPPTQGPFELPKQLTLIERDGSTTYNARRRKP
jgi:hypothetical protein